MGLAAASLLVWVGNPKMFSTVRNIEKWVYDTLEVTPPVFAPEPAKMAST